ncbi:MAG: hypothetical protein ACHP6H_07275 [Legionellales bacterium]
MDTDLKFEFKIDLKPARHASPRYRMAKIVNEPRIRQYLVLAYQIQDTISEGRAEDLGQIAGWLGMTRPRIIQITNLLLLAPDIQAEILLSDNKKIHSLPEYKTRQITKEFDWEKQRIMWRELIPNSSLNPNERG